MCSSVNYAGIAIGLTGWAGRWLERYLGSWLGFNVLPMLVNIWILKAIWFRYHFRLSTVRAWYARTNQMFRAKDSNCVAGCPMLRDHWSVGTGQGLASSWEFLNLFNASSDIAGSCAPNYLIPSSRIEGRHATLLKFKTQTIQDKQQRNFDRYEYLVGWLVLIKV